MSKNKKGVIYSTNPDYNYDFDENEDQETLPASEQLLEIHYEKKGRGGKTAIIIKGFIGSEEDLKDLGKLLKTKCGVGGSAKNGEIIIQGGQRDKVMEVLEKEGYSTKRVGG